LVDGFLLKQKVNFISLSITVRLYSAVPPSQCSTLSSVSYSASKRTQAASIIKHYYFFGLGSYLMESIIQNPILAMPTRVWLIHSQINLHLHDYFTYAWRLPFVRSWCKLRNQYRSSPSPGRRSPPVDKISQPPEMLHNLWQYCCLTQFTE
jgi:hypothetical protein